jgi:hypothetical protein
VNPDTDDQKLKEKKYSRNVLKSFFLIKNCNLLMSKLQEKPSGLKREHPALQKMKFINFFLCLCVIFALLDPGSRSRDPSESGSNPNPAPQHWLEVPDPCKTETCKSRNKGISKILITTGFS